MQGTNDVKQIKTIGKITYIVKTVFNEDDSGNVTEKLKTIIENKIVKAPLKDEND